MNQRKYWCHGSSFNELLDLDYQCGDMRDFFHDNIKIAKFTNDKSLETIPYTAFHKGWGEEGVTSTVSTRRGYFP